MKSLTEKQHRILSFLARHCRRRGFPPTLREIADTTGPANISAVRGHLAALEKKGYISRDPDKARSIRITRSPSVLSRLKQKLHEFARTDEGVLHRVVYGLVLVTRGRKRRFVGAYGERLDARLKRACVEHGWTLLEQRIEADHVVLAVQAWPNHSPAQVARRVRAAGNAVVRGRAEGATCRRIWARGYAVTTDLGQLEEMTATLLGETPPEKPGELPPDREDLAPDAGATEEI